MDRNTNSKYRRHPDYFLAKEHIKVNGLCFGVRSNNKLDAQGKMIFRNRRVLGLKDALKKLSVIKLSKKIINEFNA